jgi:hypothetical protein
MNRLSRLVRNGWPFILSIVLFGLPPIASTGYGPGELGSVNGFILTHPIKSSFQALYPVFKILPILLLACLMLFGNKAGKPFAFFAALSYSLFGFFQGISRGGPFGTGICLAHVGISLAIAGAWLGEAASSQNDYARRGRPWWKYWVLIPAAFAYWEPANPLTGMPDFDPVLILTSGAGLAFCMMTPLYLAVLILLHPKVNRILFAMTSTVGVLYALGNMALVVIYPAPSAWWIGSLHIPLLVLSAYGLVLSIRDTFFPQPPSVLSP